jgi:hypothetical protein
MATHARKKAEDKLLLTLACGATVESAAREAGVREPDLGRVQGVLFSAGVVGRGLELYAQALESGHEGVMAKRRTACYRPGRRSAAWLKIKPGAFPVKGRHRGGRLRNSRGAFWGSSGPARCPGAES